MSSSEPRVDQEVFSGPLDLLLFLVRKHEVDVFEVALEKIVDDYLIYAKKSKDIDLDNAGEFVVVGSTLIEIKSRLLIPNETFDDGDEEDPRISFILDLLKYKEVRETAQFLDELRQKQNLRFGHYPASIGDEEEMEIDDLSPFDLVSIFTEIMKETLGNMPKHFDRKEIPLESIMENVLKKVTISKKGSFKDFITKASTPTEVVGLFIAVLELLREKKIRARQLKPFGDIHIWPSDFTPKANDNYD